MDINFNNPFLEGEVLEDHSVYLKKDYLNMKISLSKEDMDDLISQYNSICHTQSV